LTTTGDPYVLIAITEIKHSNRWPVAALIAFSRSIAICNSKVTIALKIAPKPAFAWHVPSLYTASKDRP